MVTVISTELTASVKTKVYPYSLIMIGCFKLNILWNGCITYEQIEIKLLYYHVSDDYRKHAGSSCRISNIFGSFIYLSHAKISCSSDEKCIGVLEQSCDNSGPFLLCKKGFETAQEHDSSCFYEKKNYSGMHSP